MMLLIGNADDPVIVRLLSILRRDRLAHTLLDTASARASQLQAPRKGSPSPWRVGGCSHESGRLSVASVFVWPGKTIPAGCGPTATALWARIERMLLGFEGPVMNRLSAGDGNYAKVHQLLELGEAGFTVPRTAVATLPQQALTFMLEQGADVLSKGISNAKTIPRLLGARDIAAIERIRKRPLQMQQVVRGRETRLTVIGDRAFASRPSGSVYRNVEARRVFAEALVQRCIQFVVDQGLMLAGFDLCETADGVYCFEMNPTPLISHYDSDTAPVLARAVIRCLLSHAPGAESILV